MRKHLIMNYSERKVFFSGDAGRCDEPIAEIKVKGKLGA